MRQSVPRFESQVRMAISVDQATLRERDARLHRRSVAEIVAEVRRHIADRAAEVEKRTQTQRAALESGFDYGTDDKGSRRAPAAAKSPVQGSRVETKHTPLLGHDIEGGVVVLSRRTLVIG